MKMSFFEVTSGWQWGHILCRALWLALACDVCTTVKSSCLHKRAVQQTVCWSSYKLTPRTEQWTDQHKGSSCLFIFLWSGSILTTPEPARGTKVVQQTYKTVRHLFRCTIVVSLLQIDEVNVYTKTSCHTQQHHRRWNGLVHRVQKLHNLHDICLVKTHHTNRYT